MKMRFEEFIKQSSDHFEPEYNPAHWDRIEKELDKKKNGGFKYYLGGALVTGALVTAIALAPMELKVATVKPVANGTPVQKETTSAPAPAKPGSKTQKMSGSGEGMNATPSQVHMESLRPISAADAKPALPAPVPVRKDEVIQTPKQSSNGIIASAKANRPVGCSDEAFYFSAEVNVPVTYEWSFGDGKTSNLPKPAHAYSKPGRYGVMLKLTSPIDGKSLMIAEGMNLVVNQKPDARFSFKVDEDANFARVAEFSNQTRNQTGSQWIIDGKFYNEDSPRVKFNHKGNYSTALIVKNELGCYDTLRQSVVIDKEYNLLAPTGFTPNNDGQNDEFLPAALKDNDVAYTIDIIDPRSNAVIYSANRQAWDGVNHNTGRIADAGTYLWVVNLIKPDNSREIFKGNITLVTK